MLNLAGRVHRGEGGALFREYVRAADYYVKWVFLPVFFGALVLLTVGRMAGVIQFQSRTFNQASAVLLVTVASWLAVNGVGVGWGVARALAKPKERGALGDLLFLVALGLTAIVFLYGAYVLTRAAVTAWSRST